VTPFADELNAAVQTRGISRATIAEQLGNLHVHRWLAGQSMPEHGAVVELADLLGWPRLVTLSAAIRTGPCSMCGQPGLNMRKPYPPKFCSKRCMYRANDRKRRGVVRMTRAESFSRRLTLYQESVRSFCSDCTERTMVCRDASCELRGVSPARLDRRLVA
jgi:hypothetical protein